MDPRPSINLYFVYVAAVASDMLLLLLYFASLLIWSAVSVPLLYLLQSWFVPYVDSHLVGETDRLTHTVSDSRISV